MSEEDEAQQGRRKQSLDSFLHGHTSEDNASFGSMVVEADRRHQERHGWMHKDEGALAAPLDRMLRGAEGSLAIEGPGDGTNAPVTWKYTNRNSLMYIPEGKCKHSVAAWSKAGFVWSDVLSLMVNLRLLSEPVAPPQKFTKFFFFFSLPK